MYVLSTYMKSPDMRILVIPNLGQSRRRRRRRGAVVVCTNMQLSAAVQSWMWQYSWGYIYIHGIEMYIAKFSFLIGNTVAAYHRFSETQSRASSFITARTQPSIRLIIKISPLNCSSLLRSPAFSPKTVKFRDRKESKLDTPHR